MWTAEIQILNEDMIVAAVSALALKCTPFELWRPIQICWVHLNPWNWGMKHEDEVNCGNTHIKWGSTHGRILIANYNHGTEQGNVTLLFTNLFLLCSAPWHIFCFSTFFHVRALFTILLTSNLPKPNLWLYRLPAPLVFHPSSSGLVTCDDSTMTCCTSRQVNLGLKKTAYFPLGND